MRPKSNQRLRFAHRFIKVSLLQQLLLLLQLLLQLIYMDANLADAVCRAVSETVLQGSTVAQDNLVTATSGP